MNLLLQISDYEKSLLATGIKSGFDSSSREFQIDHSFSIGIGLDNRARYLNQKVCDSLVQVLSTATPRTIVTTQIKHGTGHHIQLTAGRFIIQPRFSRSRIINRAYPNYQQVFISLNPSKQADLFNPYDEGTNNVFVHLNYGLDEIGDFAYLSIADSQGGIYEYENLNIADQLIESQNTLKVETPNTSILNIKVNRRAKQIDL